MIISVQCINDITGKYIQIKIDDETSIANLCYYLNSIDLISFDDKSQPPFKEWFVSLYDSSLEYFSSLREQGIINDSKLHFRKREKISVLCYYNENKYTIIVYEDESIQDVLGIMKERYNVPWNFQIRNLNDIPSWNPRVFNGKECLIYDPDTLSRSERMSPPLYGCPTAKELLGVVPDCMTIKFNSIISKEL